MAASTLTEVARLAGVSPATASRVLNGSARIPGKDIADRVRQAAESLGYIPNAQAQGLAKSSSGLIGLIVHDIADPYFAAIARGVQEAAREQHKMVLLATTEGAPESEKEAVAAFAARRADSIVIAGSRTSRAGDREGNTELAAELDRYCRNGGHVGVIGHGIVGATAADGYHVVRVPNEELAAQLATELAASREEDFVIIGGPEGLFTSDDRIRGFQRGLADAGVPAADVIRTDFNRAGGFEAGLALAARIAASQPGAGQNGSASLPSMMLWPSGPPPRCAPRDCGSRGTPLLPVLTTLRPFVISARPSPRCIFPWRRSDGRPPGARPVWRPTTPYHRR
nr:LacI family DNA-binding transcriptional regulator [Pseudarthrobacter psychrotolerans]